MADLFVSSIPVTGISKQNILHYLGEGGPTDLNEVMNVVAHQNVGIKAIVKSALAFLKQFDTMGLIAVSSTPEELRERIRSELARWNKVIDEAGIRLK